MMEIINVSSRGQIVIPEKVRKHLGIEAGSRLALIEIADEIIITKESKAIERLKKEEDIGWMVLAEQSLKGVWDNPIDEEIWKKYL